MTEGWPHRHPRKAHASFLYPPAPPARPDHRRQRKKEGQNHFILFDRSYIQGLPEGKREMRPRDDGATSTHLLGNNNCVLFQKDITLFF